MEYSLDDFVETLLVEKIPNDVSKEVRTQLKADLMDRAENLINAEMLAHMPEESLSRFEEILDTGNDDEIQAFCRSAIPNLDEVVAGALIKLRTIYLG